MLLNVLIAQGGRIGNPIAPNLGANSPTIGTEKLSNIIQTLVAVLFTAGVLIFVIQFLLGGLKWMLSGGDKNSLQAARDQISHAIIGLVVLFAFYAIVKLIENFMGVCIIKLDLAGLAGFGQGTTCTPNNGPVDTFPIFQQGKPY